MGRQTLQTSQGILLSQVLGETPEVAAGQSQPKDRQSIEADMKLWNRLLDWIVDFEIWPREKIGWKFYYHYGVLHSDWLKGIYNDVSS